MASTSIILLLTVIWLGFSNNFSLLNLALGLSVALLCHHLVVDKQKSKFRFHPLRFVWLVLYIIPRLVVSSCQVAWEIITPRSKSNPAIIKISLRCTSNQQKLLLTIVISLTPGTLCLDIPENENCLIIHAMFADDTEHVKQDISDNLERRVMGVFEYVERT